MDISLGSQFPADQPLALFSFSMRRICYRYLICPMTAASCDRRLPIAAGQIFLLAGSVEFVPSLSSRLAANAFIGRTIAIAPSDG
jgi:hypothetical protein